MKQSVDLARPVIYPNSVWHLSEREWPKARKADGFILFSKSAFNALEEDHLLDAQRRTRLEELVEAL